MKAYYSGLILAAGVTFLGWNHTVSATEQEQAKRVIVQVKGTDTGDIEGDVVSSKRDRKQTIIQVDVPIGQSTSSFIKELKKDDNVILVEEDQLLNLTYSPNDYYFYAQYHHQNIQSSEVWNRTMGADVTVAILDNGIDLNHEDLTGKIVNPYDVVYDSPYTLSMGDHGTHVAGIVGSSINNYSGGVGVAPSASIMPIDVFAGTSAYTSDVIEGVYRAVDYGAHVINMSLGNYYYSSFFQDAINYAYNRDVVVVAAAGNDATSATHYPSSYNHVISVGSTTEYDTLSYFSNYGTDVDITAPGSYIYSTTAHNGYDYYSGTSMASPVVAGVAALVKSSEPNLSADDITDRLTSTADDLGSSGRDDYYGSGRVNAKSALKIRQVDALSIDEFSDASDEITGTVPSGNGLGSVLVFDTWGSTIGSAEYLYGGESFTVHVPRYAAGTKLKAAFYDYNGGHSPFTEIIVTDRTAPNKPIVNEVADSSIKVTGTTEKSATVILQKNNEEMRRAMADETGAFTMMIDEQPSGERLTFISQDEAGNTSDGTTVTVLDKTAPNPPSVETVTDANDTVKGKTEPGSMVTVKAGTSILGQSRVKEDGTYAVTIGKQPAGTLLSITSTDIAGNVSQASSTKVIDRTAPLIPVVSEVTDQSISIKGTAEANSVVEIKIGTTEVAKGITDKNGTFIVAIPMQPAGTLLSITSTDVAGNISKATEMKVLDRTAPAIKISTITNQSVLVTGTTEAKAKVQMSYAMKTTEVTADSNGKFSLTIVAPKTGEEFMFVAWDVPGNKSGILKMKVIDSSAPLLKGTQDISIEAGQTFDAKRNISAMDETDGDVTQSILIAGTVNNRKPGVYSLTYSVKDRSGNETKMIRRVTVKDSVKPIMTGATNHSISLNSKFYPKKGVTAKDNIDGDVTKKIQVSGSVNVKKVGTYTMTYKVSDASSNTTIVIRKITVKDNVKPVITGAKSKTIKYKSSFKPMTGVTAKDNVDGSLTKSIKVTGKVNTKRKGVYSLTYTVKDKATNSTVIKIKITVK
ncbi:S8 family serine peptidase [Exiguobacterium antarcticum]|uniref:S8 family serine peptidase n=1 Tax=Exiguobacterium antarcticum TaxID=132920 RepID=A0ABT6R7W5_9BACL|nr:S8 family serine peptidase [Exiguobacterium antarcticum]MDI3236399.1 S8 family serine peptidase [Exiguobacterium antarcticum]